MLTTTLSFENLHNHGELFANMLRARRELFIVHNKWNLPEAMGMEYDQYDTPASRWVVVHDELGRVLAGNRLTPTTAKCGIYTYMIRDAQRGLLDTIPAELLYEEADRRRVHAKLVADLGAAARQVGAKTCLTLLNANWPLWAGRVGVNMSPMGPVMVIDGVRNQVVAMDFSANLH